MICENISPAYVIIELDTRDELFLREMWLGLDFSRLDSKWPLPSIGFLSFTGNL